MRGRDRDERPQDARPLAWGQHGEAYSHAARTDLSGQRRSQHEESERAQLKRLVIERLDDSGFFAVLKERIFNSLHDEDARRPSEPDAGKLPSDLKRLEGVELVPRSGKMRAVATVERGRVLLNGRSFPSLGGAAKSVTGSSVNGRIRWRVR